MSDISVTELDKVVEELMLARKEAEEQELITKEKNKKVMELEGKCTQYLVELGRDNYATPYGTAYISNQYRVNQPADDVAKKELFDYLNEKGIFMRYASVNSMSLNSLYKSEWEAHKEQGNDPLTFSMPGIGAPKLFQRFGFRKKS